MSNTDSHTDSIVEESSPLDQTQTRFSAENILEVDSLCVEYTTEEGPVQALRDVSLTLKYGETLGIAGESGSGKSTFALAVLQYLSDNGSITDGDIKFRSKSLLHISGGELASIRGSEIAHVPQDPERSLNPSLTVGEQIAETIRLHQDCNSDAVQDQVHQALLDVDISDPEYNADRYPHELSGGMQQRVLIAMALSCNPDLLVLDEPTTGLDVTTEAKVLQLIENLKQEYQASVLLITHDLSVIAEVADRAAIFYAGEIMEQGPTTELFTQPAHPYTQGLLAAIPQLGERTNLAPIPGSVPSLIDPTDACIFADRCRFATEACREQEIGMESISEHESSESIRQARCIRLEAARADPIKPDTKVRESTTNGKPLLDVIRLKKYYDEPSFLDTLLKPKPPVKAVDGVSFTIHQSETLALVGESGCGKSTLGRTIVGLLEPTDGSIQYRGKPLAGLIDHEREQFRSECGIVFQNPESSLNPRKKVFDLVERPLKRFTDIPKDERRDKVMNMLSEVGLGSKYASRFPSALSGGEKQRVAIARAFVNNPSFVVLDEPVSALDVSVQASILDLLNRLRNQYDTSYLLISHDLSVVSHISDRVAVMYLGNIVELGSREEVFNPPHHPYTRKLLSSVPSPDPTTDIDRTFSDAELPSARDPPDGCVFHTRCPQKIGEECEDCAPSLDEVGSDGHRIRCHLDIEDMDEDIDR